LYNKINNLNEIALKHYLESIFGRLVLKSKLWIWGKTGFVGQNLSDKAGLSGFWLWTPHFGEGPYDRQIPSVKGRAFPVMQADGCSG
jgi:hypothetical protein